MPTNTLLCDGCGQRAAPEHLARRLQRLEWTTRYRPVHIATLLLGGHSPSADEDFLYAGKFEGEAGRLLDALGISSAGKSAEIVLSELQRGGFFLTHVLECPLESGDSAPSCLETLFSTRISTVMTRVRRSLKPKRVVLISKMLTPFAAKLMSTELNCPVLLDGDKPFGLDSADFSAVAQRLRETLAASAGRK